MLMVVGEGASQIQKNGPNGFARTGSKRRKSRTRTRAQKSKRKRQQQSKAIKQANHTLTIDSINVQCNTPSSTNSVQTAITMNADALLRVREDLVQQRGVEDWNHSSSEDEEKSTYTNPHPKQLYLRTEGLTKMSVKDN